MWLMRLGSKIAKTTPLISQHKGMKQPLPVYRAESRAEKAEKKDALQMVCDKSFNECVINLCIKSWVLSQEQSVHFKFGLDRLWRPVERIAATDARAVKP
jgi:hypothetical protein